VALVQIQDTGLKPAARGSLKIQDAKVAKNSPFRHHRTNLSGYIFATKARIDNRKKLLNSNSNTALNRGRHRYSAERPSRWALAHILVVRMLLTLPLAGFLKDWKTHFTV